MGWCSGTEVFDQVVKAVLSDEPMDKKAILLAVMEALEDGDWDCQSESEYWHNPLVQEVMKERHPSWFEDGDA